MKLPSDIKILSCIFKRYQSEFASFEQGKDRRSKVYVPIDCKAIADELKTEKDIIFGRLYYHLEKKYGYEQSDGSKVHLFAPVVGTDRRCVNFPLLASVLAGMQEERDRHTLTQGLAIAALIVSSLSLLFSVVAHNA